MSPLSAAIEALASQSGVPVLELQEFYLERAAIREHDGGMTQEAAEVTALEDARIWVGLYRGLRGAETLTAPRSPR